MSSSSRDLFGGALCCSLPDSFEDISVFRTVPDHQEVLVDKHSNTSITVEILSREEEVSTSDAAVYFFNDLADFNKAEEKTVVLHQPASSEEGTTTMPDSEIIVEKCFLIGRQSIPKDHKVDDVLTFLTALRLEAIQTEILITMSIGPDLKTGETVNMSHALAENPTLLASAVLSTESPSSEANLNLNEKLEEMGTHERTYATLIQSFQVNDWSLFG